MPIVIKHQAPAPNQPDSAPLPAASEPSPPAQGQLRLAVVQAVITGTIRGLIDNFPRLW